METAVILCTRPASADRPSLAASDVMREVLPGVERYGHYMIREIRAGHSTVVICQHGWGDEPRKIVGLKLESPTNRNLRSTLIGSHNYRPISERSICAIRPFDATGSAGVNPAGATGGHPIGKMRQQEARKAASDHRVSSCPYRQVDPKTDRPNLGCRTEAIP